MSEPFTPELVYDLVSAAMKGSQRRPGVNSDGVKRLTWYLNRWHKMVAYARVQLIEDARRAADIEAAIKVLVKEGPRMRSECNRHDIDAFDALIAAAKVAPIPLPPILLPDDHVERWRISTTHLMDAFRDATGGPDAAGYRFLAAVTPRVTGETPTPSAIKIEAIRQAKAFSRYKRDG